MLEHVTLKSVFDVLHDTKVLLGGQCLDSYFVGQFVFDLLDDLLDLAVGPCTVHYCVRRRLQIRLLLL